MKVSRFVRLFVVMALASGLGCGSGASPPPETLEPAPEPTDRVDGAMFEVVGTAPTPAEGASSVVILYPQIPTDVPVPTEPAEMDQYGRDFIPRLLLVRLGQPVLFKNSEDDLHTVHVRDENGESLFNVAMPIRGGLHDHLFESPGDYAVSCEAHQEMAATILVLTTPYAAVADRDGRFSIPEVPAGTYDVVLRRGAEWHQQIVEISAGHNELTLDFPATG